MAKLPKSLTYHGLTFKVVELGDGRLAFWHGKPRKVVKRQDIDALRTAAEETARSIVNAETQILEMTAEDRRIYLAAREHLAPFGLAVDAAARTLAEMLRLAPGADPLEIARYYAARHTRQQVQISASDLLTDLIAALKMDKRPRSSKYLDALKRDLAKFVALHPDLALVEQEHIELYLRDLTRRDGKSVGPRRRDNVRDGILRLFNHARKKKVLPQDRDTAAAAVEKIKPEKDVTTYTPAQVALLLDHVSWTWRPWLALAAFAGLRTSEIFRLDWSAVKWERKVIAIQSRVARKVRTSRLVPIQDNLLACLTPWRENAGPVFPHKRWRGLEKQHELELRRLEKLTGLQWKTNALRHSFGSHRLAVLQDFAQVALEMGNSPAKVREDYNDPKDEAEGKAYFNVLPPERRAGNILHLPGLEFVA